MSRFSIHRGIVVLGFLATVFIAGSAAGQTELEVTAEWNPPAIGTPVSYVLQLSTNDGTWTTIANPVETFFTFTVSAADSHRIRVAGVDAEGIQGPYSAPSASYPVSDAPGVPGRPLVM